MSRVVERLFLTVPRGCLQFVIVVFPDHTHLLFLDIKSLLSLIWSHIIWYEPESHMMNRMMHIKRAIAFADADNNYLLINW